MAEEYPIAPARMASLRGEKDKNGASEKEKKGRGWFSKNKGLYCITLLNCTYMHQEYYMVMSGEGIKDVPIEVCYCESCFYMPHQHPIFSNSGPTLQSVILFIDVRPLVSTTENFV